MILKRVGVLSVGKVLGCMYAVLGLIGGALFALVSLLGATLGDHGSALPGAGLGVLAIIFFPILYGVLGFVGGVIAAALYNGFAGMVGGIEVELSGPGSGMHMGSGAQP